MRDWAELRSPDTTSRPRGVAGLASLAAICVLVAVLSLHFVEWPSFALGFLSYPYAREYGEGVIWQQALMILHGDGYTPLGTQPHIVFHYPPVYHLTVGLAAQLAGDFLTAGRLVSIVAALVAAVLLAGLVHGSATGSDRTGRAIALGAAAAAALLFLGQPVVTTWAPLMRVDMLALALGLLGAWFGLRVPESPRAVWPAALCLALSLYTKQSYLALPVATLGTLFVASPRLGLRCIAITAAIGAGALVLLQVMTDGGFLRHIVGFNLNRVDPSNLAKLREVVSLSPTLVAIGVGVGVAWTGGLIGSLRRHGRRATGTVLLERPSERIKVFATLLFLSCTALLPLCLKSGANTNYFLEWISALVLLSGIALVRVAGADAPQGVPRVLALCAALLLSSYPPQQPERAPHQSEVALAELIESAEGDGPIVSDETVMLLRAGREVIWESAIHAELAALGRWDPRPFVRRICSGEFQFFVTEGAKGTYIFEMRYPPSIREAIDAVYPLKRAYGDFVVHFPAMPAAGAGRTSCGAS